MGYAKNCGCTSVKLCHEVELSESVVALLEALQADSNALEYSYDAENNVLHIKVSADIDCAITIPLSEEFGRICEFFGVTDEDVEINVVLNEFIYLTIYARLYRYASR